MGTFGRMFGAKLCHDTGQAVSNFVFGNKNKYGQLSNKQAQKESDLREAEFDMEQKRQKQEMMERLSDKIEDKIQQVNMLEIPDNKSEFVNLLNQLAVLLKTNPFKNERNAKQKIGNTYSDALLIKYEQAFIVFESLYPDDNRLNYFVNILESINGDFTKSINIY